MLFHFRTVHFLGFTAQCQSDSGLSLITTPRCHYQEVLCHSFACRISAFTKPTSTLAFRFITRPSAVLYVALPLLNGTCHFFAPPLQCKLFLALPSLRNSDPFRHPAQLYLAKARLFISKAKLVKSQPLQVATLRHHCLAKHFRTSTIQNTSTTLLVIAFSVQNMSLAILLFSETVRHRAKPLLRYPMLFLLSANQA